MVYGEEYVDGVDQDFVCAGVEDFAEACLLGVVTGDVAVDVVGDGHDEEEGDGGVANPLVFGPVCDDEGYEEGDQADAAYGYFVGEVHGGYSGGEGDR